MGRKSEDGGARGGRGGRSGAPKLSNGEPGHCRWKGTGPVKWERVKKFGPRTYSGNLKATSGDCARGTRHDPTAYSKRSGKGRPDYRLRRPGGPKPSAEQRMKRYLRREERALRLTKAYQEERARRTAIRHARGVDLTDGTVPR